MTKTGAMRLVSRVSTCCQSDRVASFAAIAVPATAVKHCAILGKSLLAARCCRYTLMSAWRRRMPKIVPVRNEVESPDPPSATLIDNYSEVQRQYFRAREYCGSSLDDIINSRRASRYLRDIWLLGCMVRKPYKAKVLPPGNPFRV